MIDEINVEREKSDRLTFAKFNAVQQFNKQDYKSKLMAEKYSLLPLNSQQLTPVQTAIQRMSEKHLDFEIEPVNTIRSPEIEYMSCHRDGGRPQGDTRHSMPLARRWDGFNFDVQLFPPPKR